MYPKAQPMFSKACEYGIRATIYIALQSHQDRKVSLKEIARCIDSPEAFTSKILQELARNSIVHSEKGPAGGFSMSRKGLERVNLGDIVTAIDGDNIFKGCGLGLKKCSEKYPCPIHNEFATVRNGLQNMLENTTVLSLALSLDDGMTFLKR